MMSKGAVGLQLLTSDAPPSQPEDRRAPVATASSGFFKAGFNRDARTVLLHIDGLADKDCCKQIEDEFLHLRGLISFTFDLPRQRCTVRCKSTLEPVRLCRAVARTGMAAQQIVRKDTGEEMLLAFVAVPETDEKEDMPDYLPEDETEISDTALQRTGDTENSDGWFASVSNFFSRTLYW